MQLDQQAGGAEFNATTRQIVNDASSLPTPQSDNSWVHENTVLVGADLGDGSPNRPEAG